MKTFTDEKIIVYNIDIGNLDPADVEAHIQKIAARSKFKEFGNIIEVYIPVYNKYGKHAKPIEFINF